MSWRRNKGTDAVEKVNERLERLEVEWVPIESVHPNNYNPNRMSDDEFELLCRSMHEDGFTQPIVVLAGANEIVDGEHRWRAAGAEGMTEIPVVFAPMTPAQARIATLRHNRARGSEDAEAAAAVLRDLEALGALEWAQDSLMLPDDELAAIMTSITNDAVEADVAGLGVFDSGENESGVHDHTAPEPQFTAEELAEQRASMTAQAEAAQLARERAIRLARTEEERNEARAQAGSFYRLMLLFQGDEAALVKKVLGEEPAERVLELCTEWLLAHGEPEVA